ncbi:hypothetical protein BASA50_006708 [Batrachochytrium salamandrivorans]|uniref:Prolyl endopeptidase-like n=1 Tax=Batrachochytrium salamandrivorans TaxID=1357716 RepID=A0ABQ8FCK7_9FUNG|nr:hypothetical protein BASA50_006708 [Batrachochytrium salamandrivorans]
MSHRLPQRPNDEYQLGSPGTHRRTLSQSPFEPHPSASVPSNAAAAAATSSTMSRHNSLGEIHTIVGSANIASNRPLLMSPGECSRTSVCGSPTTIGPVGGGSGAAATQMHPPLSRLDQVDEYVLEDPSNVVHLLPSIASYLEHICISAPESCKEIWVALKPLLQNLQDTEYQAKLRQLYRPSSPVCEPKSYTFTNVHGEEWHDDYAWLNDRTSQEVLDYIEAENKYSESRLEDTKPLQKLLYREFVSRRDEGQETPRVVLADGWAYFSKKIPGKEYNVHCRVSDQGIEETYLDENELTNSEEFRDASCFRIGFLKHSPDGRMIAYGVDSSGNERYTVYFMVVETTQMLPDRIQDAYEDFEFSYDGSCAYYTVLDEYERAYELRRHRIGTSVSEDHVLYHEEDEMFYLALTTTSSGSYIILNSSAQITSEVRYISAHDNDDTLHLLFPRKENIQYTCDSHNDYFYILTNQDAKNNWLYRIPVPSSSGSNVDPTVDLLDQLETVIEHRDFVLIEDFELRQNHLIVYERSNCLQNVRIVDISCSGFSNYHYISFSEVVYSLLPGSLDEEVADLTKISQFTTNILRFTYTSFVQPKQVVDYNMDLRTMAVVHEENVGGLYPYDQSAYSSRRLFATGVDGTAIPISIVFRRDLIGMNMNPPQVNPVLLHSYGAYGCPTNPVFSSSRLSLLDRGFIYAIAHIRGGADMGNGWYEEGKLSKKPNTFYDFCSVAEHLIKEGYTEPSKLAIYGRSAGGLLIGAVVTMRPDLFAAALTEVPFVDVINTMFDSSIPWTAFEYEEWGNPNDKEIYNVMKTYCPYTNVNGTQLADYKYPHLLVVGGMNDPRVAFFEPLKWVAKMRGERRKARQMRLAEMAAHKTTPSAHYPYDTSNSNVNNGESGSGGGGEGSDGDDSINKKPRGCSTDISLDCLKDSTSQAEIPGQYPMKSSAERMLLLRIDDAGHGGNSGQYSYLEDLAFEYAFLISTLGVSAKPFHLVNGGITSYDAILSPISIHASESARGQMMMTQGDLILEREGNARFDSGQPIDDRLLRQPQEGAETRLANIHLHENRKRRGIKEEEEKSIHRVNPKNDRGQRRLFQWLHNWF